MNHFHLVHRVSGKPLCECGALADRIAANCGHDSKRKAQSAARKLDINGLRRFKVADGPCPVAEALK